jgi:hypothetical protein
MKIEINIGNSHVMIILLFLAAVSTVGLVMAYGSSSPSAMGHSWSEVECSGCITSSNIADGSITNADISPTAAIDGSKITGTVPNAQDAQTVDGAGIGSSVYNMPTACGGGVTTAATCSTIKCEICYAGYGCYPYYYTCSGTCLTTQTGPATCPTIYLGKVLA